MTSRPKQEALILLDSSISMETQKESALSVFNEQLAALKANTDVDTNVSFVTFDGRIHEHAWSVPVADLPVAKMEDYKLGPSTAFYAALSYCISKLNDTASKDTPKLLVIITDGEENSSPRGTDVRLAQQIQQTEKEENWTITLVGCDADYLKKLCATIGLREGNVAVWSTESKTSANLAVKNVTQQTERFLRARSAGLKRAVNLYEGSEGCQGVQGANGPLGFMDYSERLMRTDDMAELKSE